MTTTLLQLRTDARQLADRENSQFVTDAELTNYVNSAIAELQDLLIASYGNDYYVSSTDITTVNGTDTYALPASFYKLLGVDVKFNTSNWFTIRPFNFNERNRNADIVSWGQLTGPTIRYRLQGSNIKFSPTPSGAYPVRLWFVPLAVKLVADGDIFDDLNQYSDFIIYDAAMKMLMKEEADVSVLMQQKKECEKRIMEMSQNRDVGQPESVSDIYAENDEFYWTRS
jgi:hypothetical protein